MTNVNATNYKTFGDVPLDVIIDLLDAANSPMVEMVAETHRAAQPHTALFWAQAHLENRWETTGHVITPADHNPVSLRPWEDDPTASVTGDIIDWETRRKVGTIRVPPGAVGAIRASDGSMMLRFTTDAAGAREWRRRLFDDAGYKGGVYRSAVTLDQMLAIYAPPGDVHPVTGVDNADIGYADAVRTMMAKFARLEGNAPTTIPASEPTGETNVATLNFDTRLIPLPEHDVVFAWNKVENVGMDHLGPRTLRGMTFHRCLSDGQTFPDAVDWLLRPTTRGLADAFIDHRSGKMRFINPMRSLAATFSFAIPSGWEDMAGWTNGPYQSWAASDDAKAFVAAYGGRLGANIINQDSENIEITGDYEDDISEVCKATLVQWQASRAQLLKIPWDSYPINPATGLTVIYGHREWCGIDYKACPGSVVWAWMNGPMIPLVQAKLKAAQTSATTTPEQPTDPVPSLYAKPSIPVWVKTWNGDPVLKSVPGVKGEVYATTAQYVALRNTPRLQYATSGAKKVGPDIKQGEDFPVAFIFTADDGAQYGVTWYGTRVLLADLKVVGENALKAA